MGDGRGRVIEAFGVKLPVIVFTWDGTHEDGVAIGKMLKACLDLESIRAMHVRVGTDIGPEFELKLATLWGADSPRFFLSPGDSLTIFVHPGRRWPIAVDRGVLEQDTIVLQEGAPRAIGQ